ncbi:MAG TPA: Rieske 2Fe-2S domain-containing protein, partial [Thermomicrobiales bacterium]
GQDYWFSHGYRIQRRCPHLRADLSRFGSIDNGVLTCALHGWQFDLATGRCLIADDRPLSTQPIAETGTQVRHVETPA